MFYKELKNSKYKYETVITVYTYTNIKNLVISNKFVKLYKNGLLGVNSGYAWDGASGIAINTKNTIRASLYHDALYQLIEEGLLDSSYRKDADKVLYKTLRREGMSYFRAKAWYYSVRLFGWLYLGGNNGR